MIDIPKEHITEQLQQFIKKFAPEIDAGDFMTIYNSHEATSEIPVKTLGLFTAILYNAGLNVLENMDKIPGYFLAYTNVEEFTIPYGIVEIEAGAFSNSKLNHVNIPITVERFNDYVFERCPLKNVEYQGTKEDWNNISKDARWIKGTTHFIVHCIDGDMEGYEVIQQ